MAGGLQVLFTFPAEYVKTQLQLDRRREKPVYKGVYNCVNVTVKNYGILGLYRGLSSFLYGSIPKTAVRFSMYQHCYNLILSKKGEVTKTHSAICGLAAGVAEAVIIVCPMETVKVILINDHISLNPKYKGFFRGVSLIVKENGIQGVYKGLIPTALKQGSNQSIRFLTFESMKSFIIESKPSKELNVAESFAIGVFAGTISVFANSPLEIIKTRLQGIDSHMYKGFADCFTKIYRHEGILE